MVVLKAVVVEEVVARGWMGGGGDGRGVAVVVVVWRDGSPEEVEVCCWISKHSHRPGPAAGYVLGLSAASVLALPLPLRPSILPPIPPFIPPPVPPSLQPSLLPSPLPFPSSLPIPFLPPPSFPLSLRPDRSSVLASSQSPSRSVANSLLLGGCVVCLSVLRPRLPCVFPSAIASSSSDHRAVAADCKTTTFFYPAHPFL